MRRAGGHGIDGARFERRDTLADIAKLDVAQILERIDIEAGERRLSEHVRVGTDPVDAQTLAFEIRDLAISFLPTMVPVMRFLVCPIITRFFAPPAIARIGANPPMTPTSRFTREHRGSPEWDRKR